MITAERVIFQIARLNVKNVMRIIAVIVPIMQPIWVAIVIGRTVQVSVKSERPVYQPTVRLIH